MTSFVYTPAGYVNMSRIEMARHKKNGKSELIAEKTVIDDDHVDFESTIVSVTPISGEWECLSPCEKEDGSNEIFAEPVLAWGLTAIGYLTPITPTEMEGVKGTHALRKVGEKQVYSWSGVYENADSWLADMQPKKQILKTAS